MKSEKPTDDLSLKNFSKKFTAEIFHIDKRIFKTIAALFFKPGELAASYFSDKRERFVQPLKLYFAINFVFFFLAPLLNTHQFQVFNFNLKSIVGGNQTYQKIIANQTHAANVSREIYEERFDAHLKYNQPAFVFLVVPIFALFLYLLNFKKRRFYAENFIFAAHFLSFFLLLLLSLISLFHIFAFILKAIGTSQSTIGQILVLLVILIPVVYLFFALRKFYRNKIILAIVKAIFLFVSFLFVIGIYVQFLFFYTILALKWAY
ncbi:MAG: DUF3667 domain-containing protein [Calditrichaeota bacterium]|nr:DUF3667 domain-containing protein [Calditrichota bacterium]